MSNELLEAPINIDGRDWTLKANLGFLKYLNDRFPNEEVSAKGLDPGLLHVVSTLRMRSAGVLIDLIKAGTATEPQKPSTRAIEDFINQQDDLEWLFEQAIDGLGKSAVIRGSLKSIKHEMMGKAESEEDKETIRKMDLMNRHMPDIEI